MSTELMLRRDFTRTKIIGQIKDVTNQETNSFNTTAIKQKNKITYVINQEKYTLKIISPDRLILNRKTDQIDNTMYFEKDKVLPAIYNIKENDLELEIEIKTNKLEIKEKKINISYTVIDSNTEYEYNIEMSE